MPDQPRTESSDKADQLKAYLADRDAPCPGCGYNLCGVQKPACPECGLALSMAAMSWPSARRINRLNLVFIAWQSVFVAFAILCAFAAANAPSMARPWLIGLSGSSVLSAVISFAWVRRQARRASRQAKDGIADHQFQVDGCLIPPMVFVGIALALALLVSALP